MRVAWVLVVTGLALSGACPANGGGESASPAAAPAQSTKDLRRAAYAGLQRPISLDVTEAPLEDVLTYMETVSGVTFAPAWLEGNSSDGLERDVKITVKAENLTTLALLERVLDKAGRDRVGSNTWQLSDDGMVEVGPKTRLNAASVLRLYDVNDLLYEIPNFTEAPQLDLDSVLNQSQGGGTGSIFQQTEQAGEGDRKTRDERVRELLDVITSTIETEQWTDNGGDGASIREHKGVLLIKAPDYIHRQIGGYDF